MRAVNSPAQGREPLQPLPTMQRPMTPPQTQRQSPKYGGMAKSDSRMSSPKKDGHLQIATREEIDMFDSVGSDDDGGMGYYDALEDEEDEGGAGTSTTVKMYEKPGRSLDQSQTSATAAGWQVNHAPPPPPPKSSLYSRSESRSETQVGTAAQSRYGKSDNAGFPRSSATSSTAMSPPASSVPAFGANLPRSRQPEQTPKTPQRRYDALEDILLPALDEVHPLHPFTPSLVPSRINSSVHDLPPTAR